MSPRPGLKLPGDKCTPNFPFRATEAGGEVEPGQYHLAPGGAEPGTALRRAQPTWLLAIVPQILRKKITLLEVSPGSSRGELPAACSDGGSGPAGSALSLLFPGHSPALQCLWVKRT